MEESLVVNSWIAKGEARGEVRESQAAIIRLGTKKFGTAPEGVETAIRAIADHDRLTRIIDRIFDAVSWEDLLVTP